MPKHPIVRKPDPNPIPVSMRSHLSIRYDNRPKPTLPRVRWLEREVDEGRAPETENSK